jgi:large subunit ribosomal protein L13
MSTKIINKVITGSTKTHRPKLESGHIRDWYILDASKMPLGRLATIAANLLTGKNRADYSSDVDMGGCVVVINTSKTVLTGMKPKYKTYMRHSGRPGSLKGRTFEEQMQLDSTRPVYSAIKHMLPKNRLQDIRANNRLHLFDGSEHSFTQQLIPAN